MYTKICGHCDQERDISLFKKHKKSKDGLRNTCNVCLEDRPSTIVLSDHGINTYKGQVKKALERKTMEEDDFNLYVLSSIGFKTKK